jgi:hypothetical protein
MEMDAVDLEFVGCILDVSWSSQHINVCDRNGCWICRVSVQRRTGISTRTYRSACHCARHGTPTSIFKDLDAREIVEQLDSDSLSCANCGRSAAKADWRL